MKGEKEDNIKKKRPGSNVTLKDDGGIIAPSKCQRNYTNIRHMKDTLG